MRTKQSLDPRTVCGTHILQAHFFNFLINGGCCSEERRLSPTSLSFSLFPALLIRDVVGQWRSILLGEEGTERERDRSLVRVDVQRGEAREILLEALWLPRLEFSCLPRRFRHSVGSLMSVTDS